MHITISRYLPIQGAFLRSWLEYSNARARFSSWERETEKVLFSLLWVWGNAEYNKCHFPLVINCPLAPFLEKWIGNYVWIIEHFNANKRGFHSTWSVRRRNVELCRNDTPCLFALPPKTFHFHFRRYLLAHYSDFMLRLTREAISSISSRDRGVLATSQKHFW